MIPDTYKGFDLKSGHLDLECIGKVAASDNYFMELFDPLKEFRG